jgi:hypothetical protein
MMRAKMTVATTILVSLLPMTRSVYANVPDPSLRTQRYEVLLQDGQIDNEEFELLIKAVEANTMISNPEPDLRKSVVGSARDRLNRYLLAYEAGNLEADELILLIRALQTNSPN